MIDSTLFGATIAAGTYAAGDTVPMQVVEGPAVVRSGRGSAILKRIMGGAMLYASTNTTVWRIHVKNSDWIDDAIVATGYLNNATALDQHSGIVRIGNNSPLTPNSAWQVYAECIKGGTPTTALDLFALIDIDYPQVSSIIDPDTLQGVPASIPYDIASATVNAAGSITSAAWETKNVDYLKAGYQYALQEMTIVPAANGDITGFVAICNAAGMGGLERIIPVSSGITNIRQTIEYCSILTKGPMDVKTMFFSSSATTSNVYMIHDFVKRRM